MKKPLPYVLPIVIGVIYAVYFYVYSTVAFRNGLFVSIHGISSANVGARALLDLGAMLILPLGLLIAYRQYLEELELKKSTLSMILLAFYILLFLARGDFTVQGIYHAFFYLFIVALPEELIFRGYLYSQLKRRSRIMAILVSGALFGIMHAILPGILEGVSGSSFLVRMLNEVGSGIVGGWLFILLLEYSGSLFVPIMVHALLDYGKGWGLFLSIATYGYLVLKSKALGPRKSGET